MSVYSELTGLGVTVRPLQDPKPPAGGRYSPFSASFTSTIELLANELRALDAQRVVIELDVPDRHIRADGLPRADAKTTHPGVALAFESRYGPLRYATAEFTGRWGEESWQANLRAIALAMEALRKVDRYGVSKRGEQYQGWRALPSATGIDTVAQARDLVESYGGLKKALMATHPDTRGAGVTDDDFRRVMRAKELLRG